VLTGSCSAFFGRLLVVSVPAMRTDAVPADNPARLSGGLPEAWSTGAYLSMLAIASWSAAGETRNKPVYGRPSSRMRNIAKARLRAPNARAEMTNSLDWANRPNAEEQDHRPGHDHDHQAGADWMTGELQVREDAPVGYLSCERAD
jgi:hypothetical protein